MPQDVRDLACVAAPETVTNPHSLPHLVIVTVIGTLIAHREAYTNRRPYTRQPDGTFSANMTFFNPPADASDADLYRVVLRWVRFPHSGLHLLLYW